MSKHILHIDSSPMGDRSVSKQLSQKLVNTIKQLHPDVQITTHNFGESPLPHLSPLTLQAFFTPADQRSPDHSAAIALSDRMVTEFLNADIVVIGAPMWNLNIPSALKAWIDHIVRAGLTFTYTSEGAQGLVEPTKKVIIVSSRGGVYTDTVRAAYDFQETYLKAIFGFLGIRDISIIRAEGVSMGEEMLKAAIQNAEIQVAELAKTI
ncbi:FMN-dependent NADH-azoreductase [bacterium]|nr:FMN-dependent NADH-azoreductase [bacterium]